MAIRARFSPEHYRVLFSRVNLRIDGAKAEGNMQLELLMKNEEMITAQLQGPLALAFVKERGDWKISSAAGWQQWAEGLQ